MRLLLFVDVHCSAAAIDRLVAAAQDVDVVVGAGDFARQHDGLDETIRALGIIDRPAIVVPGNNETDTALRASCANSWPTAHVLHGETITLDDVTFFGLGAGVPVTPFGAWSFDLTEEDATGMLASCPPGAVLVSHSPPHGALDVDASGARKGSRAIRAAIERTEPTLVVCGHIHPCAGQETTIGGTRLVNPGPMGQVIEI